MNDVKLSSIEVAGNGIPSSASSKPPKPESDRGPSTSEAVDQQALRQLRADELAEQAREGQQQVKEAVTRLNDYVQSVQRDLQFQLDDDSGKTIVTVIDRQTSEVVRQIPDEVAVRLAQDLQQDEPLSLFDARV